MAKTHASVEMRLTALLQKHQDELDEFASQVRADLVVPFCQKYGYGFMSGMGTFFFHKAGVNYSDSYRLPASPSVRRSMIALFDLLNTETAHNDCLGYHVQDVPE